MSFKGNAQGLRTTAIFRKAFNASGKSMVVGDGRLAVSALEENIMSNPARGRLANCIAAAKKFADALEGFLASMPSLDLKPEVHRVRMACHDVEAYQISCMALNNCLFKPELESEHFTAAMQKDGAERTASNARNLSLWPEENQGTTWRTTAKGVASVPDALAGS